MKRWKIERMVLAGFVLATALLIFMVGLGRYKTDRHHLAYVSVVDIYTEASLLDEILLNMSIAETAHYRYLVTHEQTDLKLRNASLGYADKGVRVLEQKSLSLPMLDALRQIKALGTKRVALFNRADGSTNTGDAATISNQYLQDRISAIQMVQSVAAVKKRNAENMDEYVSNEGSLYSTEIFLYAMLTLSLPLFLFLLYLYIRHEIKLRFRAQATLAETRERKELAHELHDDLGQVLSLTRIKLALLLRDRTASVKYPILLEINNLVKRGNQSVRLLLAHISSPTKSGANMLPMLDWLTQELRLTHDIDIQIQNHDDSPLLVPEPVIVSVIRGLRILLVDMFIRGGSGMIKLTTGRVKNEIFISLKQDGSNGGLAMPGQSPGNTPEFDSVAGQLRRIGGKIEVASAPGSGTTVTLFVPAYTPKQPPVAA